MGEAKRRRAGSMDRQAAGPVEDFRVEKGKVAITFDIAGSAPATVLMSESALTDVDGGVDEMLRRTSYRTALLWFVRAFREVKAGRGDETATSLVGLWLALHHPHGGAKIRRDVADLMASGQPVHITMFVAPSGALALAVADRCKDLGPLLATVPRNKVVLVQGDRHEAMSRARERPQ